MYLFIFSLFPDLLCTKKEIWSCIDLARHPPRGNADVCVVRSEVHSRRPLNVLRPLEHIRPHYNVCVLHVGGYGPASEAVPVVEEILDYVANGELNVFFICSNSSHCPIRFAYLRSHNSICTSIDARPIQRNRTALIRAIFVRLNR